MVKHIVMWRLKDGDKAADAARMKTMLEALPAQIKQIRSLEVGINGVPGDAAADVVLITEFNCFDCLQAYQVHPAHQEVVAFVKTVAAERRVIDWEV